jgi:hypothetical protein
MFMKSKVVRQHLDQRLRIQELALREYEVRMGRRGQGADEFLYENVGASGDMFENKGEGAEGRGWGWSF